MKLNIYSLVYFCFLMFFIELISHWKHFYLKKGKILREVFGKCMNDVDREEFMKLIERRLMKFHGWVMLFSDSGAIDSTDFSCVIAVTLSHFCWGVLFREMQASALLSLLRINIKTSDSACSSLIFIYRHKLIL